MPLVFPNITAISTHTSRVGCDDIHNQCLHLMYLFLLTHPVWDVTSYHTDKVQKLGISTHTSRVGCDILEYSASFWTDISTHTSRVGCDSAGIPLGSPGYIFLLTHPVWDVTLTQKLKCVLIARFLLTHPVWDVTYKSREEGKIMYNFYSHIPCGM